MHDQDGRNDTMQAVPALSLPALVVGLGLPYCLVIGGGLALRAQEMTLFGAPLEIIWIFACFILVPACLYICWRLSSSARFNADRKPVE
ncbi:hypothetical protein CFR76_02720 [Komagataeibacter swingsii]|uniref:DUF3311 domain-containing protein n=2 Tax=Komagataeibacter swingsii TaxID=215220 RepID=A0A2V4RLX3_9PROT|nr:hypothetical protein CFR76_02720 [Komagataeibacter swingsii]